MFRLVNVALVLAVLASAFVIYSLEHANRSAERRLDALRQEITDTREGIKLLKAEWSNLTRPERVQKLAEEHLKLVPLTPTQLVSAAEAVRLIPDEPRTNLNSGGKDPIADILKEME